MKRVILLARRNMLHLLKMTKKLIFSAVTALVIAVVPISTTFAVGSNVTQAINPGTLSTSILDASRVTVASPSFGMTTVPFSFSCQTTTGTLGTTSQRLYVTNASNTTGVQVWTLAMAATGPWTDGGSNTYAYNDATSAGCTNGQLTVNPSVGTVTPDCTSTACTGATIVKGSSTGFTSATPITIMSSTAGQNVWRGYITGVSLSQAIPPEVPAASYSLPVTLTVTAA